MSWLDQIEELQDDLASFEAFVIEDYRDRDRERERERERDRERERNRNGPLVSWHNQRTRHL